MGSFSNRVTVDRAHIDTLIRRANCNPEVQANHGEIVSVPKEEYECLLIIARQFANLKRNLMQHPVVTEETIALLVQDPQLDSNDPQTETSSTAPTPYPFSQTSTIDNGGARLHQTSNRPSAGFQADTAHRGTRNDGYGAANNGYSTANNSFNGVNAGFGSNLYSVGGFTKASYQTSMNIGSGGTSYPAGDLNNTRSYEDHTAWGDSEQQIDIRTPSLSVDGPVEAHDQDSFVQPQIIRPVYAKHCTRTIALCGLPKDTTYADVTNEVRGGKLIDICIRTMENIALVSFLLEDDAVVFYNHARRNDLYIKHKRIFIKWADRHYTLPPHVAGRIAAGHTRNMIIRRCGSKHTEESIRDDLEHIHNLIVIRVEFRGDSCYIKTNSVQNAMYARTCMTSRLKYKGSKIEWDADECDQPIQVVQKMPPKPPSGTSASTKGVIGNRFSLLRLDDDDNEIDDRFDTSSDLPSTVGVTA